MSIRSTEALARRSATAKGSGDAGGLLALILPLLPAGWVGTGVM
ncbi:hypothetical protein [Nonomuraea composti]|nr:hypothetical protein [Nonomuraea sp. FMUSA5-5]